MTAWDAIRWTDEKLHNTCSSEDKLTWLSQLEAMARELRSRCGMEEEAAAVEPETVLSFPEPYEALCLRWLEAQIHYTNQEYLKYNNAMQMFTALWQEYANSVRRSAAGVGRRKFF